MNVVFIPESSGRARCKVCGELIKKNHPSIKISVGINSNHGYFYIHFLRDTQDTISCHKKILDKHNAGKDVVLRHPDHEPRSSCCDKDGICSLTGVKSEPERPIHVPSEAQIPVQKPFEESVKELLAYMKWDSKIPAIKIFRGMFDTGLKDAKDEIERVYDFHNGKWLINDWVYQGKVIANGLIPDFDKKVGITTDESDKIKKSILDKVKDVMINMTTPSLHPDEIKMETTFEEMGLDSLDCIELLMGIEERFEIDIADEEAEKCKSMKDIVEYLHKAGKS